MRGFWAAPPRLGAVARLQVNGVTSSHPGPAAWWAMYPVYALGGRTPEALSAAVAAMALGWICSALAFAMRRGGTTLTAMLAIGVLLWARAAGPTMFVQPWNPWFAVPAFLCLVLATWSVVLGSVRSMPVVVVAASFCTQAHLGYAPIAAALTGLSLVCVVATVRRPRDSESSHTEGVRWKVPISASLGLLGALWVLPMLEQLRGNPGNLGLLWRAYRSPAEPAAGSRAALGVMGGMLDLGGPWLVHTATPPRDLGIGLGTFAFGVLVIASVVVGTRVGRRQHGLDHVREALALHFVLGVAIVGGFVATSRILGEIHEYLVPWWSVLAMLWIVTSVWTVTLTVAPATSPAVTGPRSRSLVRVSLFTSLLVSSILATVSLGDPEVPGGLIARSTTQLAPQVRAALDPAAVHLVRWEDPIGFGGIGYGLLLDLERHRFIAGADRYFRAATTDRFVVDPESADDVVWIVTGQRIAQWRGWPGSEEIATSDPRSPRARAASAERRAAVIGELERLGGRRLAEGFDSNVWMTRSDPSISQAVRDRIDRLVADGLPTAVFVTGPDVIPPPGP